jgi:UrcA family protein
MLPLHKTSQLMIALLMIPALLVSQSTLAAAPVDEVPSKTVRYHDLNLNSPEGIASLYGRIHTAALDVCKSAEGPWHQNLESWIEWDRCVNHAVADAVQSVHNEKLGAYHWQRIRSRRFHQADYGRGV